MGRLEDKHHKTKIFMLIIQPSATVAKDVRLQFNFENLQNIISYYEGKNLAKV